MYKSTLKRIAYVSMATVVFLFSCFNNLHAAATVPLSQVTNNLQFHIEAVDARNGGTVNTTTTSVYFILEAVNPSPVWYSYNTIVNAGANYIQISDNIWGSGNNASQPTWQMSGPIPNNPFSIMPFSTTRVLLTSSPVSIISPYTNKSVIQSHALNVVFNLNLVLSANGYSGTVPVTAYSADPVYTPVG